MDKKRKVSMLSRMITSLAFEINNNEITKRFKIKTLARSKPRVHACSRHHKAAVTIASRTTIKESHEWSQTTPNEEILRGCGTNC
ncbi:hypothetical protein E2C01_063452 [Portunus trituberculatus]|uniref:Uncharacterized protein n=1 Tax=Portunus trituberculatus TaxID=210409 RepID=A0A5B7HI67_PORTR|nr:hypothetical protein [Portunus trituberculatus]